MNYNPEQHYRNGQNDELEAREGKYESPSNSALAIAAGMSVLEAGFAFALLLPSGLPLALTGAGFPVVLLWAMAYVIAEQVEIPKEFDRLEEEYNATPKP